MEKALEINTWLWQYGGEAMQYIWKSNNDKGSSSCASLGSLCGDKWPPHITSS